MLKSFNPVIFLVFLLLVNLFSLPASGEKGLEKIILLHTNDEHGNIEGFGRIAWKKERLMEKFDNVFLVSGGDIFSGNPVVDRYIDPEGKEIPGKPMVKIMDAAGYDAMVIGNHDFDYGQKQLQKMEGIAGFSFLLANVEVEQEAILERPAPFWITESSRGTSLAFLGLIEVGRGGLPSTHPSNLEGLAFVPPVHTAREFSFLEEAQDIVIALTHLGLEQDKKLAREIPYLDIIIGGHSHTVLEDPLEIRGTPVAQAGSNTRYLGRIDLSYCLEQEEIADYEGTLLLVEEIEGTCPEVEGLIERFQEEMACLQEVIGYCPGGIQGRERLGSLLARAMVERFGLDFAFQNMGGVRQSYLPPQISRSEIHRLAPFDNPIVLVEMKGRELESFIAHSFRRRGGIDLLPAGGVYEVVVNEIGEPLRVIIRDGRGQEIDDEKTYFVGLNSYVARTYFPLPPKEEQEEMIETTGAALIKYIVEQEKISPPQSGKAAFRMERSGAEGTTLAESPVPFSTAGKKERTVSAGTVAGEALRNSAGAQIGLFPTREMGKGLHLEKGSVNKEILELFFPGLRYDNEAVVLEIEGRKLEQILLGEIKRGGVGVPFQVSLGFGYRVKSDKEGVSGIRAWYGEGPLEPEKTYEVALNSYILGLWEQRYGAIKIKSRTGLREKEALVKYLEKVEVLPPGIARNRIKKK